MQFFFADDSAYKSTRNGMGKLVAFGGILIDGAQIRNLSKKIDAIANDHGIPPGEELKWSPRKGSWIFENLINEKRISCYSAILQAAVDANCKIVVVACDYEMRNLKAEWGFERCITYTLERISTHLSNTKSEAVIIADRPSGGPKEADQFLASFVDHLNSQHNHMVEDSFSLTMLTAPSHMVRHLQLADLVVSITTAMLSGQQKWASQYFELIKPMFIRNAVGYIGGTGVKVYPNQLTNLYHWVLGENHFSKAATMSTIQLPNQNFHYFDSDGT